MTKPGFKNLEVCAKCEGACCKYYAGGAWPEEFEPDIYETLVERLMSGKWAIDQWEGDPREDDGPVPDEERLGCCRYVRPAHKAVFGESPFRQPEKIFDCRSYGGECVFLDENGCQLEWNKRPTQCRMLKPRPPEKSSGCDMPTEYDKRHMALAWLPYQDVIQKAGQKALSRIEQGA